MGDRHDGAAGALRTAFDTAAEQLGSALDAAQHPAADRLADVGARLLDDHGRPPRAPAPRDRSARGVYLHGPVGRGKTWLVDVLVDALTQRLPEGGVRRLHAYDAARQLHRAVAAHAGRGGVEAAVAAVVGPARALFLDELHAHDPGDAMLLSRLLRALPAHGAALLATSNHAPAGLLPDPRHHHLVLPLVAAVTATCDVVEVAGPVDHRSLGHGGSRPGWSSGAWLVAGGPARLSALGLEAPHPRDAQVLRVGGRPLPVSASDESAGVVHLRFEDLCGAPTSTGDLLELADRFSTVVLASVPALATADEDARRRFANLVDVFWDRDVRLVVLATGGPEEVLEAAVTDHERMRSRLSLLRRS